MNKEIRSGAWDETEELFKILIFFKKNGLTMEILRQITRKGGKEKIKKILEIFSETTDQTVYDDLRRGWEYFYAKYQTFNWCNMASKLFMALTGGSLRTQD